MIGFDESVTQYKFSDQSTIFHEYEDTIASLKEKLSTCKLEQNKLRLEIVNLQKENQVAHEAIRQSLDACNHGDCGMHKFLRTLSYAAKLASGFPSLTDTADKFKIFSSEMSGARVILRLLDDIPNLHHALSYGWSQREPDWFIRTIKLIKISVDLFYGPVEHICWAGENKLIPINIDKWGHATVWFWISSLYLSLLKTLRRYRLLMKQEINFSKSGLDPRFDQRKHRAQLNNELLICVRLMLDLSYAVSYLPHGTLWGGKFSAWQVGALGTISSLIGVYQALSKRIAQKNS